MFGRTTDNSCRTARIYEKLGVLHGGSRVSSGQILTILVVVTVHEIGGVHVNEIWRYLDNLSIVHVHELGWCSKNTVMCWGCFDLEIVVTRYVEIPVLLGYRGGC